jgi:hypothetical protein
MLPALRRAMADGRLRYESLIESGSGALRGPG